MKKLMSIVLTIVFLMGSLTWVGCTPEQPPPEVKKSEEPKFKVEPLETSKNIVIKPSIRKPMAKKNAVTKVTKEGNVYTLKLNTNKLKPGEEVHLCIGYIYFPVSNIEADGTVKVKVDWTPPGNPRISAGVWNGNGVYVTSMLVTGG